MSRCGMCGLEAGHDPACRFGAGAPVAIDGRVLCVRCRATGFDRLDGILADFEPPGPVVCICSAGAAALRPLVDALIGAADRLVVAVEAHPGATVHLVDRLSLDATWRAALADLDRRLLPALAAVVRAVDPLVERDALAVIVEPGDRIRRWLALSIDPLFPGRGARVAPEEDDSG